MPGTVSGTVSGFSGIYHVSNLVARGEHVFRDEGEAVASCRHGWAELPSVHIEPVMNDEKAVRVFSH